MHRRRRYLSRFVVTAVLLLFLLLLTSPAVGFEIPEPDHGIEEEEFDRLWSGYEYRQPSGDASANDYLTKASDYAYAEPPGAPDRWNKGEVESFFGGTERISQHPPDAELHDGEVIKDAYVSIFDVSRSTRVIFSPQREVFYIPSDGEVRGFTDYRIEGENVTEHSVEIEIAETDGVISGNGGFSVPYEGLRRGDLVRRDPRDEPIPPDFSPGDETAELTLRANVTATREVENEGETETVTETVTVNDTVEVQPYNIDSPTSQGPVVYGQYPNDDTALFFLREVPWSSVRLPDGTKVQSNWRFFSTRAEGWGNMQLSTASGSSVSEDVYHPLRVYAFPSRSGVYVDGDADIRNILGDRHDTPSLPEEMSFDLPRTRRYTSTHGFDLRYDGESESGNVELNGILHGTSTDAMPFPDVQRIIETDLTLEVVDESEDSIEVEVSLSDEEGNPIDTRRNDGIVRIDGRENVETGIDGKTTFEISPRPSGGVVAEYVPVPWYEADTPYAGDTASVNPEDDYQLFAEIGMLSQLGVFLLPFLLSVYFLDRALGLGIWPPWRRI
ncbi:MAG: hypothetical protein U5J64_06985 [Halobacteriales archaeon]|nr:hypothetical protein [Halobacteriales archaeon]